MLFLIFILISVNNTYRCMEMVRHYGSNIVSKRKNRYHQNGFPAIKHILC